MTGIDDGQLIPMRFPNESDGTMDVTYRELRWLVANGHVNVRAEKIRRVTITAMAEFYKDDATVRACQP